MERIGIGVGYDIEVNGESRINQLRESVRATKEDLKDLEKYSNQTNYNSMARNFFNEQNNAREQLRQYGLDSKKGIEAYQKNYRQEEIARLTERISNLNDSIKDLDERIENTNKNDTERLNQLTETRKTTSDEKNSLENKLNNLLAQEKGGDSNNLGKYFGLKELGQVFQFAGNIAQAGFTYRQDIASGNVIGASRREKTSIANSIGGAATALGTGLAATGIGVVPGAIIAALGMGTSFISRLVEGSGQAGDAEAQAYMNNFGAKYGALRAFRNVGANQAENTVAANQMFSKLTSASIGTGLDAAEISRLVQEAAKQGVGENRAFAMATNAGKWNQATGANIDTMLRLQGMAERYGLGQDVVATAYGGLKASNMQKAQLDEFLNGLQTVIENGISNGYIKSADEVAAQMTMFAKLSGDNPLWQGQNGVNNIMQMNAGLSASTSMGSIAQNIAMGAAKKVVDGMTPATFKQRFGMEKTGSYLDYEMMLQNPNGAVYGQILKDVQSYSGGNVAAQKEFLQQIFGISSTKTLRELIGMTGGNFSESTYQDIIGNNKITPSARTEETSWSDLMNRLTEGVNNIGQGEWQKNIAELNSTVQKYLIGSSKNNDRKRLSEEMKQANKDLRTGINIDTTDLDGSAYKAFSEKATSMAGTSFTMNQWIQRLLAKDGVYEEFDKNSNSYKKKTVKDNERFDKIMLESFSYAAAQNDGVISNEELMKFRAAATNNRALDAAYIKGDETAFLAQLEITIRNAFKGSLPSEFNLYEKD